MTEPTTSPRPMKLTFGGRVPLDDIVGRDDTVTALWREVESNSVRINEMRRFGKTTVLRLMEAHTPDGWFCVRTSVQDARSTLDMIELTLDKLLAHAGLKERAKNIVRRVLKAAPEVDGDIGPISLKLHASDQPSPGLLLRNLLSSVDEELTHDNKRLLIIWDEFPDAVRAIADREGPAAAQDLLALFRANRENDAHDRIRWVLTGSVGFHHVLRMIGGHGGEIGDLTTAGLDVLTPAWTRWLTASLLLDLDLGVDVSPAVVTNIADVAGGIPFVVAMMVKYIRDKHEPLPRTPEETQELLANAAGDLSIGANFTPLLLRVDDYYGDQAELAEAILDAVANVPLTRTQIEGMVKAEPTQVAIVLDLLAEDHYLDFDPHSELYVWRFPPLRMIWRSRRRSVR